MKRLGGLGAVFYRYIYTPFPRAFFFTTLHHAFAFGLRVFRVKLASLFVVNGLVVSFNAASSRGYAHLRRVTFFGAICVPVIVDEITSAPFAR